MHFHFINYGTVFQDREYCLWSSHLPSFMTSLHRERAASSIQLIYQRSIINIHDEFAVAFLKNKRNCWWLLPVEEWQSDDCIISGVSMCLHLQREAKHFDRLIILFGKLKAKATKLTKDSLTGYSTQHVEHV